MLKDDASLENRSSFASQELIKLWHAWIIIWDPSSSINDTLTQVNGSIVSHFTSFNEFYQYQLYIKANAVSSKHKQP